MSKKHGVLSKIRNQIFLLQYKVSRHFHNTFKIHEVSPGYQQELYDKYGLDRAKGLERLNSILWDVYRKSYDEEDGMFSEHLVLLASISVDRKNYRILEIGTYDARTALLLSRLFSEGEIVTIDLPSDDALFNDSYDRTGAVTEFINVRDENLKRAENVVFYQKNSLALALDDQSFDLIWVDGAHGYPVVSMDIINAFRLCSEQGWVLIDDVWTSTSKSDAMYKSVASFESLGALVHAGLIEDFTLIPKRLGSFFNIHTRRKYVGMFKK